MIAKTPYPKPYSVKEVAQIFEVNPGVIYRQIKEGRLVARKVGRQYRIHEKALDDYLLNPWGEPEESPERLGYGCDRTMVDGSFSTGENRSQPELAAQMASQMLRKH